MTFPTLRALIDEGDAAPTIRCGDHVYHATTEEMWLVAYVDGDYLAWCGWPEGEAKLSDCKLVKSCSDQEHLDVLNQCAIGTGKRARKALAALRAYAANVDKEGE